MHTTFQVIFDFFGLSVLGISLYFWWATIKLYKNIPWKLVQQMIQLTLRTARSFRFVAGVFGILGALAGVLFPEYFPPLPFIGLFTLGMAAILNACLPPAVLVLTSSKPAGADLVYRASEAIAPLQLVHLLDGLHLGIEHSEPIHDSGMRTLDSEVWEHIVWQLMKTVPIVVIDTRFATPALIQETKMMLSPFLRDKAIFVVWANKESPSLTAVGVIASSPNVPICVLGENQAVQYLARFKRSIFRGKGGR